jgi:hypothetical protein
VHPQLAFDHRGGECAQHIQTEVGPADSEVRSASAADQLGDRFVGKGIKKRGGDHNGFGAISALPDREAYDSQGDFLGDATPQPFDTPFLRCPV